MLCLVSSKYLRSIYNKFSEIEFMHERKIFRKIGCGCNAHEMCPIIAYRLYHFSKLYKPFVLYEVKP